MKTLYITRGNHILIDTENNSANKLESVRQGIDYIFLAEEPMHIVYGYDEAKEEADAEKGDIVVVFYLDDFKKKLIVLKNSEDWANNIIEYKKKQQEEKERWAEANREACDACPKTC